MSTVQETKKETKPKETPLDKARRKVKESGVTLSKDHAEIVAGYLAKLEESKQKDNEAKKTKRALERIEEEKRKLEAKKQELLSGKKSNPSSEYLD